MDTSSEIALTNLSSKFRLLKNVKSPYIICFALNSADNGDIVTRKKRTDSVKYKTTVFSINS
jgi:hypothetical protein